MTNILQIIESTGHTYKKAASTKGGEYKGPCPFCGGDDRFSIHPNSDHWVCRRCKRSGDSLQFFMDFHNMSYIEACIKADRTPEFKSTNIYKQVLKEDLWTPRPITRPPLTWQSKAEAIAFHAFKNLMSSAGKPHREYLHNRGLTIESIKQARIGYNPTALSFDRESWGIPPELAKNGTQKNVWIPEGFIIPLFHGNQLIRMRIRQADPGIGQRYILVAGSSTEYMSFPGSTPAAGQTDPDQPVDLALALIPTTSFLVESELDAKLCNQEFGHLMSVYAIGNTTARPDIDTHAKLVAAKRIVLCLDNDAAGADETAWWEKQYGADKVESHPVPSGYGKDPGEAYEHGFDLKTWGKSIAQHGLKDIALKQGKERAEEGIIETSAEQQEELPERLEQPEQQSEPVACLTRPPDPPIDPVPDQPPESCGKLCLHGQYCVSAKDGTCLISKQRIFDMANGKCPQDYWYSYGHGPNIRQIIFGVNFKRPRRQRFQQQQTTTTAQGATA